MTDGDLPSRLTSTFKPAAVRHADHDLLDARHSAVLDEIIQQGDEGIRALEREALLAHVLRVQVALEALGHGQLPQKVAPLGAAEGVRDPACLEFILQPQPLLRIRHVGKLRADRAGVDVLKLRQDVAQLHLLRVWPRCGCR